MSLKKKIARNLRNLLRRLLGVEAIRTQPDPSRYAVELPVGEAFERLNDRMTLLEAQLNWRLFGLPAPVGNIRAEQAGILAHQDSLLPIIKSAAALLQKTEILAFARQFLIKKSNLAVLQMGLSLDVQALLVLDIEDLFLPAYSSDVAETAIRAAPLSVLVAQADASQERIWLGDCLMRLNTIKALLVLREALRVAGPTGAVAGEMRFQDDPPAEDLRPQPSHSRKVWNAMAAEWGAVLSFAPGVLVASQAGFDIKTLME